VGVAVIGETCQPSPQGASQQGQGRRHQHGQGQFHIDTLREAPKSKLHRLPMRQSEQNQRDHDQDGEQALH
jgi:hypothetical protein